MLNSGKIVVINQAINQSFLIEYKHTEQVSGSVVTSSRTDLGPASSALSQPMRAFWDGAKTAVVQ